MDVLRSFRFGASTGGASKGAKLSWRGTSLDAERPYVPPSCARATMGGSMSVGGCCCCCCCWLWERKMGWLMPLARTSVSDERRIERSLLPRLWYGPFVLLSGTSAREAEVLRFRNRLLKVVVLCCGSTGEGICDESLKSCLGHGMLVGRLSPCSRPPDDCDVGQWSWNGVGSTCRDGAQSSVQTTTPVIGALSGLRVRSARLLRRKGQDRLGFVGRNIAVMPELVHLVVRCCGYQTTVLAGAVIEQVKETVGIVGLDLPGLLKG
jgi:hypothetical protein